MSKKKGSNALNLGSINAMVASLSNDLAEAEGKLKISEDKNKELENEAKMLSSEIQTKAIEISNLKLENEKLNKKIGQLNEKIEENKKVIEELTLMRKVHEAQNYNLVLQEKNKLEKDKEDLEKKLYDMKKNIENEQKKYVDLDQRFYQYKKEYELDKNSEGSKITTLEQEIKTTREELIEKNKIIEENKVKYKEITDVMENLRKVNEKIKSDMENLKTDSYNKIEDMKIKMGRASQSVFSPEKILNIVGENIHTLFAQEFSISLNRIIEDILKNFIIYTQSIFDTSENGDNNIHNDENIYLYFLKDIYFYIYFYVFNLKISKNESDISISSNDFTEEIINKLTGEIYKNNIIHLTNDDSQKIINDYMNNLKKLGVDDYNLTTIKDNYTKKNENLKIYLLNIIKSIVKKYTHSIRNSTIENNN